MEEKLQSWRQEWETIVQKWMLQKEKIEEWKEQHRQWITEDYFWKPYQKISDRKKIPRKIKYIILDQVTLRELQKTLEKNLETMKKKWDEWKERQERIWKQEPEKEKCLFWVETIVQKTRKQMRKDLKDLKEDWKDFREGQKMWEKDEMKLEKKLGAS